MNRLIIYITLCLSVALGACQRSLPHDAAPGDITLFPDYEAVTVPVNIAPLNFRLPDERMEGIVQLKTGDKQLITSARNGAFRFPEKKWKALLQAARGSAIDVSVYFKEPASGWQLKEFPIYVSPDSVDGYLTYRRIFPGYRMWHEMGIYQRSIENFAEKPILTNRMTNNSCMNCHAFQAGRGERMLFHQRSHYGGTYLVDHDQVEKINWAPDGKTRSLVYPYWHPSGRYIAFSTNETHQDFHFSDSNRIEVYDGHQGPFEINCGKEFTDWLTDPTLNGGGAVIDFGCYGANLATRLMGDESPLSVYAVLRQNKPDRYPRVDDDATIIVNYPSAVVQIMGSWCWPMGRKDMHVYGERGYIYQDTPTEMRVLQGDKERYQTAPALPAPYDDSFRFLRSAIRGEIEVPATDLSSLENNLVVMRILDAAIRSAREKRVIPLDN